MADKMMERAAKAAGMISLMFLVSRILGFVRESLSGQMFARLETDAFIAAFIIPDTMYYLLVGGALSAAFIPVFNEYLTKGEEEEGWRVASTFINITVLILTAFTLFGVIFSEWMAPLEAPGFTGAKMDLLVVLTRLMFPAVCFTAMAGLMTGALNSYKHFFAPALGPVFYNIAIIGCAVWLGPSWGIRGMALGVVVGAIGNFLIQVWYLRWFGGKFYRFGYIDLKNPGFRRMLVLMVPALLGLSATQINLWVTNVMASSLAEGSITALRFANRLIQLPIGIFAAGIATAFFPLLAGMATNKQMDSYKDTLALSMRSIFFLMVPAGIGLMVLGQPIVKLLFEGHLFTPHDTQLTVYALLFYSVAIFAHAAILMLPRAYYALQDTVTPVVVSIGSVLLSIVLNWVFLKYTALGVGGFALSFSIMGLVNMVLLMEILRRKIGGIRGGGILRVFLQTLAASLVMAAAIWLADNALAPILQNAGISGRLEPFTRVLVGIVVGAAVFLGAAWLLRMNEIQMALRLIRRKLPAKDKAVTSDG
jgi:putative peptidoglycan lipid II flippase